MEIIYQKDRLNKKFEISDLAEDTKYNISIKTEFDGTEMDPACLLEVHTFTKLQAPINLSSKKIANDSFSLRYANFITSTVWNAHWRSSDFIPGRFKIFDFRKKIDPFN